MCWLASLFNAPAINAERMLGGMLALSVVWIVLSRASNG